MKYKTLKKLTVLTVVFIVLFNGRTFANKYTSTMPFLYSDLLVMNAYEKIGKTESSDWYGIMINETAEMFCGYIDSITDTEDENIKQVKFTFDINNLIVPIESITCYAFSINWDNTGFIKSIEYKNKITEVSYAR